jgi:hypothetical protein
MIKKTTLAIAAFAAAGLLAAQPTPAAAQNRNFFCESRNNDRTYCDLGATGEVRFIRQLSDADCVRGRTWDIDRSRGRVWVTRGCRAEFAVGRFSNSREDDDRYDRDRDRDDRDGGRWDDRDNRGNAVRFQREAERICRSAVRDRVRNARGNVDVRYSSVDRAGNRVVRWSTDRRSGYCRVDRADRLTAFNYSR